MTTIYNRKLLLQLLLSCYIIVLLYAIDGACGVARFSIEADNGLVCNAEKTFCRASGGVKLNGENINIYADEFFINFNLETGGVENIKGKKNIKINVLDKFRAYAGGFDYVVKSGNIKLFDNINIISLKNGQDVLAAESVIIKTENNIPIHVNADKVILERKNKFIIKAEKLEYDDKSKVLELYSDKTNSNNIDDRVRMIYLNSKDENQKRKKTNKGNI